MKVSHKELRAWEGCDRSDMLAFFTHNTRGALVIKRPKHADLIEIVPYSLASEWERAFHLEMRGFLLSSIQEALKWCEANTSLICRIDGRFFYVDPREHYRKLLASTLEGTKLKITNLNLHEQASGFVATCDLPNDYCVTLSTDGEGVFNAQMHSGKDIIWKDESRSLLSLVERLGIFVTGKYLEFKDLNVILSTGKFSGSKDLNGSISEEAADDQ